MKIKNASVCCVLLVIRLHRRYNLSSATDTTPLSLLVRLMETAEGNPSACQKKIDLKMIGLDWSGKTTILYKLKLGNVVETIPTIGYNVETFEYKDVAFSIWDIGGRHTIRPLWRHNFTEIQIQGLAFVVDSSDRARIQEAREELMTMLEMDEIKYAVLLILANKQDLPNAMSANEIAEKLGLDSLNNRKWYVQETSAITNSGLCEGLDWLCQHFGHC